MKLPVRQYRCHPLGDAEYDEASFGHVHREIELDPEQTALITIDLWNMGWEDEPLSPEFGRYAEYSFLGVGARAAAEARRRVTENLAPALHAARAAGMTVIHSNTERAVRRYPECAHFVDEPADPAPAPDWPPPEIGEQVMAEYLRYTFGEGTDEMYAAINEVVDFPEPVRPVAGDFCVCQQAAVDDILRTRRITTVIHAGFLLGHCLMDNAGGVRHLAFMWRRPGYRDIVLRDCTIAQESRESIEGFQTTGAFIFWLEAIGIPTAAAADFVSACGD